MAGEHEEAVLHDVGFYEGEGGSGLVGEDIHRQVEAGDGGEEGLEAGVFVAEEGLAGDVAGVAVGDGWGLFAFDLLVGFPETVSLVLGLPTMLSSVSGGL